MTSSDKSNMHDEIEDFQFLDRTANPHDEFEVYESGKLHPISIDELMNNKVAIKQLLNAYNTAIRKAKNLSDELYTEKAEVEYYKTSPFVSILSAILNVIFMIIIGIGVNIATGNEKTLPNIGPAIYCLGGLGTISSSVWPILYPYAKGFFNKRGSNKKSK
ncbi:MAG: hypothetical protein KDK90_27670 [Leptospiraceae bacterium]|nr:hypothetical protein [Leptospiraceae bacterium]